MIPDRRFRPEPMTAAEAIDWLKTHRYVWYQAPMDSSPRRLFCKSKLKLWKRDVTRFEVSLELPTMPGWLQPETLKLDNSHLDRLRMPFELWHHGITATVTHVDYVGYPHQIAVNQSNGYHLQMGSLRDAIRFAKSHNMELAVIRYGRKGPRKRILVPAHPPISGERTFQRPA